MFLDGKRRKIFHDGRTSYSRQRSKRISPLKRRDFFNQCRFSGSDRGFQLDDRFNSAADKRVDDDNYCAGSIWLPASAFRLFSALWL